ncbi:hypothetical protein [Streptosporangium subroseum]|uniref:hypothetical protein n=1 Tax=Streptosporangium subroseum TaxID=106412 RepID=UPI00308E7004|nr:hypothetical protein OHB15_16160 [Streptosporangium subroseum]
MTTNVHRVALQSHFQMRMSTPRVALDDDRAKPVLGKATSSDNNSISVRAAGALGVDILTLAFEHQL